MCNSAPVRRGVTVSRLVASAASFVSFVVLASVSFMAHGQGDLRLEALDVQPLGGQQVELRLRLSGPVPEPMAFTTDDPARLVIDLPNTANALAQRRQDVNVGPLTNIATAESNDRTRVQINMAALAPYQTRVEGNTLVVTIGQAAGAAPPPSFAVQPRQGAPSALPAFTGPSTIENIDFRRGTDGAGQILVDLSDPRTTVDVREEGGRVIVDFQNTGLPQELLRRLDVTDFATPVTTIDATRVNGSARLIVTPSTAYDRVAYQSDDRFTLELKPQIEEPQASTSVFDETREYTGDRLTLNFQSIDTRAVLQLIADFSDLNIVVSDTVQGQVTLRLQNVPWDQALDIVMTTKGLDMRRNGNVVIVAPAEEIAAREQADLQARQQLQTLEPLRSEFVQVNYAKATELAELIRGSGGGNSLLSPRGTVAIDARTNTLLVQDTTASLAAIRRLVTTLDVPVRQVSIETRVVIVNDDYSRSLGVRFGTTSVKENSSNGLISLTGTGAGNETIVNSALENLQNTGQPFPVSLPPVNSRYNVNLPVSSPAGQLALAVLDSDFLVDLELSALQAEGNGRIVSTPRVVTTNQKEARILQGVEVPYQESASSGATTTQFKEAVLSLTVTPQITPDRKIIMDLHVSKDSVGELVPSATGGSVPTIDTREVVATISVNDGETVVLGGIYETELRETANKVPVLGDLPGIGALFRSRTNVNNNAELLIFVTPRILPE